VIPPPTAAQKQALLDDRDRHRLWLRANQIEEVTWPLSEDPYTGLLLASLLDPDASPTVCRGLLAGGSEATPAYCAGPLTAAQWPTQGVDLVVRFGHGANATILLVEHKRFHSHSHAPGYKTNPDAPWQTDQVYAATTRIESPPWLCGISPRKVTNLVVLDAYGKSMEQLFPGGQFNDRWLVTSYQAFGAVLRAGYRQRVGGLVPLLAAMYAGC
jgi:hypothetical protein